MHKLFNCGVWISVSLLLTGSAPFTSTISPKSRSLNQTFVGDKEDTGFDSPFLQLKASLPLYSQPIRPYTLQTNADYHSMSKPRHSHPFRLQRLLGSSLDLFWMSIKKPSEVFGSQGDGHPWKHGDMQLDRLQEFTTARQKCHLRASPILREAAANHLQMLEREVAGLDLNSLPSEVAGSIRNWLVHSATCGLSCQWVDLGPAFWPRWLRKTDCESSDGEQSCSFPGGMECVRGQTTSIKILAWHCLEIREGDNGSRGSKADRSDVTGTGETLKNCAWRPVPYPVVTACKCSFK